MTEIEEIRSEAAFIEGAKLACCRHMGIDPNGNNPQTRRAELLARNLSLEGRLGELQHRRRKQWALIARVMDIIAYVVNNDSTRLHSLRFQGYQAVGRTLGWFYTQDIMKGASRAERKEADCYVLDIDYENFAKARKMNVRPIIGTRVDRFGRNRPVYAF